MKAYVKLNEIDVFTGNELYKEVIATKRSSKCTLESKEIELETLKIRVQELEGEISQIKRLN